MRASCSHEGNPTTLCPTKNQQDFVMNGFSIVAQKKTTHKKQPIKNNPIKNKNGIKCGFWNILADGLAYGEFISKTGDSYTIPWDKRGPKVCNILKEMMNECDFVCTVENDMCLNILSELRYNTTKNIKCVYLLKITPLPYSGDDIKLEHNFNPTDDPSQNKKMSSARKFKKSKQFLMESFEETKQSKYYKEAFGIEQICKTKKMIKDLKKSYMKTFKDQVLNHSNHKDKNELTNLATQYAKLYGKESDGIYESEDGIAIFYDANSYEIVNAKNNDKPVLDNDYLKVFISTQEVDVFLPVRFKHKKAEITYDIIAAHLSAGESAKDEIKRLKEIAFFHNTIKTNYNSNVVIVMDSNVSRQYLTSYMKDGKLIESEKETGKNGDNELEKLSKNGINQNNIYEYFAANEFNIAIIEGMETESTYKCFKMRHAKGGQPKKFGELMYDTIDKCYTSKNLIITEVNVRPEYNKIGNYHKVIDEIRNDDTLRKALKTFVVNNEWGDEMRGNDVEGLSNELKLGINDGSCKDLFYNLYPNEEAPSDHPAFIFTIEVDLNPTSSTNFGGSKSQKSAKLSKKSAKKSMKKSAKKSKKKSLKKSKKKSKKKSTKKQ